MDLNTLIFTATGVWPEQMGLTVKQVEVLAMSNVGATQQEMADALGIGQRSVSDRMTGAIKKLRKFLEANGQGFDELMYRLEDMGLANTGSDTYTLHYEVGDVSAKGYIKNADMIAGVVVDRSDLIPYYESLIADDDATPEDDTDYQPYINEYLISERGKAFARKYHGATADTPVFDNTTIGEVFNYEAKEDMKHGQAAVNEVPLTTTEKED